MTSDQRRSRVETAAWIVGLPLRQGRSAPIRVDEVESIDDGWRLVLDGRALDEPVRLTVTRVMPGETYFARSSELGLRHEGRAVAPGVRRLLLAITRRLARLSFAAVRELLGDEPAGNAAPSWDPMRDEARQDRLPARRDAVQARRADEDRRMPAVASRPPGSPPDRREREGADAPAPPTSGPPPEPAGGPARGRGERPGPPPERRFPGIHQAWNHPLAWAHFVADEELMPARDVAFQLGGESVRVEHGDFECQFVDARGFVVRPWAAPRADRGRGRRRRRSASRRRTEQPAARPDRDEAGRAAPSPGRRLDPRERSLFTNLRDLDAIDGGTERFEQLLRAVREHVRPEVLMVNCTCVPQIVGDDAEFVVAEERRQCPFPIVYKDQRPEQSPHERGLGMMREALGAESTATPEPNVVNLVGFTQGRDRDELRALLGELGIEVQAMVVPDISPAHLRGFGRASLHAVFPNPDWLPFCEKLLGGLAVPMVTAPAPYGCDGTREFLATVAHQLDRDDLLPAIDERAERFRAERWARLVEQAARERVGLVCEIDTVERLGGIDFIWGCPVLPLVLEMGFGVSIALVARSPEAPRVTTVRDRWTSAGAEVALIEDEGALRGWLDRADVSAVYSDFFFDSRLLRTGHPPFSSRIFEKGWAGAARGAERLLDRCRLGLIRHDSRHLF